MNRLPRLFPCVALAGLLSMPLVAVASPQAAPPAAKDASAPPADTAAAPPATAPAAAPATQPAIAVPEAPANQPLADQADDFWHYGEVGRYDLQAIIGKRLIAATEKNPEDLLKAFEQVAGRHHRPGGAPEEIDGELLRWQAADPQVQPVVTQIIEILNNGRFGRRQDPQFIADNIHRLNQGERAYMLAIQQLRASGELAVPQMVAILVSPKPEDLQYHDAVRRALVDLGRSALNPLLVSTQMNPKDPALTTICGVLGDIGYDIAEPYLLSLSHSSETSDQVKESAAAALRRFANLRPDSSSGNLFYALAEKYYYGTASIQPDPRSPKAFVWYWENGGLSAKQVPPQIFNDIMTMRETEHALRENPSSPDQAVALWLAGNIRRSIDLPSGQTDPTRAEAEPLPHYYGVAVGAQYLNLVLSRSLTDNTPQSPAVALAAIRALQDIVGQSNLFSGGRGQPLVEAMRSSDRQVRIEAAFALAAALPQTRFQGQDRVVPLLAEAITQSGTPGVLVIASQQDRTRLAAELKGYATAGASDAASALAESSSLPAVDVIILPEDVGNVEIDKTIDLCSQNPRLQGAAKLIIVHSLASPWAKVAVTDPSLSYTEANSGPALANAVEAARKKAGGLPVDEKVAGDFALRAADLLAKLAISRGQVLNLSAAEETMIGALGDKRPQIAEAVGQAVGLLNSARAQSALADRGNAAGTATEVRISLYGSLATSAKFYGNRLSEGQVNDLRQVAMGEKDLKVRDAAAQALGALNLPAMDSKALLLERHD